MVYKKILLSMMVLTAAVQTVRADIPMGYYQTLDGKCGEELKTAIHNLVSNNVSMLSYGSGNEHTWWGFYVTDYIMNGSRRQVVDRYSNEVRYFGNRDSSVSGMNIEHSFPKSWWGGSSNNAYKDLYNLMPCEKNINTSKSNYGMGVVTSVTTDNGCTKVGTGAGGKKLWEPANKWKGEFARGYMYMATAYQNFTWEGQALNSLQQGAYPTLQKWASDLYIDWAEGDPVDQMEIDRNQAVAGIQGNRNPFVDFPNLMHYVWGDSIDRPLNLKTTVKAGQVTPVDPDQPIPDVIFNETFLNDDGGGCTSTGTGGIWTLDKKYGWKGTAFIDNVKHEADASLVTPEINLSGCLSATLTFDHAANFVSAPADYLFVEISCDGGTPEVINSQVTWPAGKNWDFNSSGNIDLGKYLGHNIKVIFHYTSTTSVAGTWEIKNMRVAVTRPTAVDEIIADPDDENAPAEYYSTDGRRLDPETATGIVIVRRGNTVKKVIIR